MILFFGLFLSADVLKYGPVSTLLKIETVRTVGREAPGNRQEDLIQNFGSINAHRDMNERVGVEFAH